MILLFVAALGASAITASPIEAIDDTHRTPTSVVHQFLNAREQPDFAAMARLFHPDELEEFKRLFTTAAESDPSIIREFPTLKGMDIDDLDASVFLEMCLAMFEEMDTEGFPDVLAPGAGEIIGEVKDGKEVHVVCRREFQFSGVPVSLIQVVSTKLCENKWYISFGFDVNAFVFGLLKEIAE